MERRPVSGGVGTVRCADNAFMDGRGNCINGTKIEVNHEENLEDLFGIVSNHERLSESTEELKEKKN